MDDRARRDDILAVALLAVTIGLASMLANGHGFILPYRLWQTIVTIFLSVFLEALPFVLLGVVVSSLIHACVSPDLIARVVPRNRFLAHLVAGLLGLVFPICECGIIPVVRSLIRKGLPVSVGVVMILAIPIVNPVVATSTYVAFGRHPGVLLWRLSTGYCIAVGVGLCFGLLSARFPVKQAAPLQEEEAACAVEGNHGGVPGRLGAFLAHLGEEFFEITRFLVLGAFLSAIVQSTVSREWLIGLPYGRLLAVPLMMLLAYLLSICSEADAFVASSFRSLFPIMPLLGFMVFGAMLDLKSTVMLRATFARHLARRLIVLIVFGCLLTFLALTLLSGGGAA